jgi:hypothetical protein
MHKTCDFTLDSKCGIGYRSSPELDGPPCEQIGSDPDAQCRAGLYCDVEGDTSKANRCYGKVANGNWHAGPRCNYNHQCASGRCKQYSLGHYCY